MAVSLHASGTQTAVIATEHQLDDVAATGVFTFHVDINAMVSGDTLELRVYQMILTAGVSRVAYLTRLYGAQADDNYIMVSPPIGNNLTDATSLRFSLKQTAGTGRAFPWKVLQY